MHCGLLRHMSPLHVCLVTHPHAGKSDSELPDRDNTQTRHLIYHVWRTGRRASSFDFGRCIRGCTRHTPTDGAERNRCTEYLPELVAVRGVQSAGAGVRKCSGRCHSLGRRPRFTAFFCRGAMGARRVHVRASAQISLGDSDGSPHYRGGRNRLSSPRIMSNAGVTSACYIG